MHIIFFNILLFSCETRRFMIDAENVRIHSKKAQVRSFNICLENTSMARLKSKIECSSVTLAKATRACQFVWPNVTVEPADFLCKYSGVIEMLFTTDKIVQISKIPRTQLWLLFSLFLGICVVSRWVIYGSESRSVGMNVNFDMCSFTKNDNGIHLLGQQN